MLLADCALSVGGTIDIGRPVLKGVRYIVPFSVPEGLKPFFRSEEFWFECPDAGEVPESIAVVPAVANLLPFAWVFGCELRVRAIDKSFYDAVPEIRRGYDDMVVDLSLSGTFSADEIIDNSYSNEGGSPLSLFSGGVDAWCTLARHSSEKPHLVTVWGADVDCGNESGWKVVDGFSVEVANNFNLDYSYVRSNFREMVAYRVLDGSPLMSACGYHWWHDLQHGIAIIGLASPLAYACKAPRIYIASSNTEMDKPYVCASDPTIDNRFAVAGCRAFHDGYELTRQGKVDAIVRYARGSACKVSLRVCYHVQSGRNCCRCEKCARTILEILAAGGAPKDFGFDYTSRQFDILMWRMEHVFRLVYPFYYRDVADAARANAVNLPRSARWVFSKKLDSVCDNGFKRGWDKFHRFGASLYHGICDCVQGKVR
mgnify:FL=1